MVRLVRVTLSLVGMLTPAELVAPVSMKPIILAPAPVLKTVNTELAGLEDPSTVT